MCLTSSQLQPSLSVPGVPAEATTQRLLFQSDAFWSALLPDVTYRRPQIHQELMMNGDNLSVFVLEEKHLSGTLCAQLNAGSAEAAGDASLCSPANQGTITDHGPGDPSNK